MTRKLLIALLIGALLALPVAGPAEAPAPEPETTAEPGAEPSVAPSDGDPAASPAKGYVLVSTATQTGWLPLPEEGEYSYDLKQILPDGTEAVNTIHLTPEGVYMEASTCENHDCVKQGMVTLENRKDRILSNMIICLPNQVYLQLFTPEEILEMVKEQ